MANNFFKIRPAGRHILTIGRDLIQDPYAAVLELVKNSYDADAVSCHIKFMCDDEKKEVTVVILDDGHGMSEETVEGKWMVPSTDDKAKRKTSPNGRIMQGRKGIGRYAASILGNELFLETVSNKVKTSLYVNWDDFAKAEFLDDVEILIESAPTQEENMTKLTISGGEEYYNQWSLEKQYIKLISELKKLKAPLDDYSEDRFGFSIYLQVLSSYFPDYSEEHIINPYPLFDLFDYRISGTVFQNGKGNLEYSTQKTGSVYKERISFDINQATHCGVVEFDIRVYDREPAAIEKLIERGLKDENGNYLGKLEARRLLDSYNGLGVYRNGFRIRPLGDANYDWLTLNEQRVQKPTIRIGSNQVIGLVKIESEEKSGLIEKSARDGLIDNEAFESLISLTRLIIEQLEIRRFEYRKKAGLSRKIISVEKEIERLYSFDSFRDSLNTVFTEHNASAVLRASILELVAQKEKETSLFLNKIKESFAIYQGQATLGKIINVVLHEGRKPLNFFKNNKKIIEMYYQSIQNEDFSCFDDLIDILDGFDRNTDVLINLFSKIDPLAMGKRGSKKPIIIKKEIIMAWTVFESESKGIELLISEDLEESQCIGWKQDLYSVFTNLFENSIYWINTKQEKKSSTIIIDIHNDKNGVVYIDYLDSGPGIDKSLINSGLIFEPEFSTKPNGTGLGLSIAGESARRLGFELKVLDNDNGAYFRLERNI